jgi:aryl-alcohol dehydrogenase-like predicted oxidoreductase
VDYRNLGHSGLPVSVVGLGCDNFGPRCDPNQSAAIVHRALDLGITFFDTADIYGPGGLSEEYLGKALKSRRQDAIIATKFVGPMGPGLLWMGTSRRYIMYAIEGSLRRLSTDYIDLYQIHFPFPGVPMEETLRALEDLVRQGKVRYIGCSNFAAWQIVQANWIARTEHLSRFISAQNAYNLLDRQVERELVPACIAHGVGILPYFSLASGFLTGKYRPEDRHVDGAGRRHRETSQSRDAPLGHAGDDLYGTEFRHPHEVGGFREGERPQRAGSGHRLARQSARCSERPRRSKQV